MAETEKKAEAKIRKEGKAQEASSSYVFAAYTSVAVFAPVPDAGVALFYAHALAARISVDAFAAVSYAFAALSYTDTAANTLTENTPRQRRC